RAGKDAKDAVQVEYLAAIMQQTGEEWQGVDMMLSTAEPRLNAAPPELMMLAVNVVPRSAGPVAQSQPVPLPPGQALAQQLPRSVQMPPPTATAPPVGGAGGFGTFANPAGINTASELDSQAKMLRKQAQVEDNNKLNKDAKGLWNYAGALDQARDL